MKTRVVINKAAPYEEYRAGDTGIVDGYCKGGRTYAIVILDRTATFVQVPIEDLGFRGWKL